MRSEDQEKARRVENENFKQAKQAGASCGGTDVGVCNQASPDLGLGGYPYVYPARQCLLDHARRLHGEAAEYEKLANSLPVELPYDANQAMLRIINSATAPRY